MNYLAHLYLADDDPESVVGSLMGDFVKGPVPIEIAERIRQGILVHRKIDTYTDAHPLIKHSKRLVRKEFRRYGGILIDVFYDHFLARHWSVYSSVPLRDFSRSVYGMLGSHYHLLPAPMQRSVAAMIANDWLMSYRELAGIARALRGIEGRLKRESRLREALKDLEVNYAPLEEDFTAFFPELIAYVRQSRNEG